MNQTLLIDGMLMQKKILYDTVNSKYIGFVDYGNILVENSETPTSESLVFVLAGFEKQRKCAIV